MKFLVLTLILIVMSGTASYTGINSILNNNQVQAQQQEQIKINKVWETFYSRIECLPPPPFVFLILEY